MASRPGAPFDGWPFQAIARHFLLGATRPYTYCPYHIAPCRSTTLTVFQDRELVCLTARTATLLICQDVRVPGGQQTYIEASGAFAFTLPHSDERHNFYSSETTARDGAQGGGFFGPGGSTWLACAMANATNVWQVYADLARVPPDTINPSRPLLANSTTAMMNGNCTEFMALVRGQDSSDIGVWQYM